MKVSVFGLGYVGCVTAACLAHQGHGVIGVDINEAKVRAIQEGLSPLIEPGVDELIRTGTESGRLHTSLDVERAVWASEVSLVCVGTPSRPSGGLDQRYVLRVCEQIGQALTHKDDYHVVAIRSTVLPDTLHECLLTLIQSSGKMPDGKMGFVANPEFLREGSAVHDFHHPSLTVIGQSDARAGDKIAELYAGLPGAVVRTEPDTAMLVKYASNAFHALKVAFANEMGSLCAALGVDEQKVMDIFCQDMTLNISPRYLRPGFAFGGSCLPKDLRALLHLSRHLDLYVPLLESILPSNQAQIQIALERILSSRPCSVGLIGLSFKPNTDDLRESPMVQLAETLLGKGCQLKIYDQNVDPKHLVGANRAFVEKAIPHLSALMCDSLKEVITTSDVVVVSYGRHEGLSETLALLAPDRTVIDLNKSLGVYSDEQRLVPVFDRV